MRRALLAFLSMAAAAAACKAPEASPLELVRGGPDEYDLRFDGNASFDDAKLAREAREPLQEYVESGLKKYAVDDAAYTLRLFYESEGFPRAEVDYEVRTEGRKKPLVVLQVREGVRTELTSIDFVGNEHFEGDNLRKLVTPDAGGLFGEKRTWYSHSRLEAARGRIEALYYESGYLDVQVELDDPRFSPDLSTAEAAYTIREGPRYVLNEVKLDALPEEWRAPAEKALKEVIGKPWFPRVGYEVKAKIEDVAANRGHPQARATVSRVPDTEPGDVRLDVSFVTGPEVHVGEIRVVGNERTKAGFIRSRLELDPGDLYDRSKQRESFRNLYATGIFERVDLHLDPDTERPNAAGEGVVRDLVVEVKEGPSLEVYVEPGYGSYEGPRILTGVTERNLFGTGRRLTLEAAAALRAQSGTIRFTEPNLFGPHTDFDLEGFAKRREEPSFTSEDVGGAAQVRHRFSREVSAILRFERSQSRATDISADVEQDILDQENVDLSIVSLAPAYDTRNAPFLPTRGMLARFTTEVSAPDLGSEIGYVRLLGTLVRYFPTGTSSTFAVSFRSGVLIATDGTESFPIQLRFFNGGENTVRSFRESELGPKDQEGDPLGGEVYNVYSMEYRRMLFSHLQGAVFFDAGNVLDQSTEYGSFDGIRTGVGVGLRYLLPIGPVRLDFGVNPDPKADEDSFVLHFSLGTAY